MKVQVINSRHSHVTRGTIGDASCDTLVYFKPGAEIEVRFPNLESPKSGFQSKRDTTVMMLASELEPADEPTALTET